MIIRKYSLQEVPVEVLENLKKVERAAHWGHQELGLAELLCDRTSKHQEACEVAPVKAMLLVECQAKELDGRDNVAIAIAELIRSSRDRRYIQRHQVQKKPLGATDTE